MNYEGEALNDKGQLFLLYILHLDRSWPAELISGSHCSHSVEGQGSACGGLGAGGWCVCVCVILSNHVQPVYLVTQIHNQFTCHLSQAIGSNIFKLQKGEFKTLFPVSGIPRG